VPEGKAILKINLDETSVCLFQGDQKGNVLVSRKRARDDTFQKVGRNKRRCCLTHVGLICDRPDLQPIMPQFVIGNKATFKAKDWDVLVGGQPRNVHLVRQQSAWNNTSTMKWLIRKLGATLQPHMGSLQPVLILDACKVHLSQVVFSTCVTCQIWPVVAPAKLTWLLQPLDTHAFKLYKARLQKNYQNARIDFGVCDLTVEQFLKVLYTTIREVLQGKEWGRAFNEDGFGQRQLGVSEFVKEKLAQHGPLQVSDALPTQGDLELCFPKNAAIHRDILLRPFLPPREVPPPRIDAHHGVNASSGARAGVAPRTRAEHRAVAAEAKAKVPQPPPVATASPLPSLLWQRSLRRAAAASAGLPPSLPKASP
jgi:hypothetical protein